jgi:hypothetical protein
MLCIVWGRRGDSDDIVDGLKHRVGPAHHIVIPKSYHSIAFRLQPTCPDVVAAKPLIISVLRSIDLDYEPLCQTGEIGNVRSDDHLPPEVTSLHI